MDRTVIDTWKAEEKEFGEKLHRKLTALTMIHPPTDEFKQCFVEDMFLKPNQKAFFHVMHYLFNLLDPAEFKKRFYWPLAEKKSEASFRSSTIQYLTHLNEKHNLQWNNIKSYLVVMPGGMKFIVFLLDLIDFITKELIKQRERYIAGDVSPEQFSEFNIKRMKEQNKLHKEYASKYIKAIDTQIASLKENLDALRKHISTISISKLSLEDLMDDAVLSEFAASNRQLFESNVKQRVTKVTTLEEPLKQLKEVIDRFQNHETSVKCDKEMVKRSLLKIKSSYPDIEAAISVNDMDGDVKMNTLLAVFNRVYPDVEQNVVAVDRQNDRNDFISTELNTLKKDIIQIETHLNKFLSSISENSKNPSTKITPARGNTSGENVLFSKFVNTPPIKLDIADNKAINNPRLPFLDDFLAESFSLVNQQNTLYPAMTAPRSARKPHDNSMKCPSTAQKSKILDPARLLRTLNKDTSRSNISSRNLSSLASKWKKHESMFGPEDADTSQIEHCQTVVTMTVNSSFDANEKTTIARQQLDISLKTRGIDASIVQHRRISAVQKVQDTSLNLQNLSTSPSGRLDPLVAFDPKEFPKIKLNDKTLFDSPVSSGSLSVNCPRSGLDRSLTWSRTAPADEENDLNVSNLAFDFRTKLGNISTDKIFDTSDGVLNDITM